MHKDLWGSPGGVGPGCPGNASSPAAWKERQFQPSAEVTRVWSSTSVSCSPAGASCWTLQWLRALQPWDVSVLCLFVCFISCVYLFESWAGSSSCVFLQQSFKMGWVLWFFSLFLCQHYSRNALILHMAQTIFPNMQRKFLVNPHRSFLKWQRSAAYISLEVTSYCQGIMA